MKKIIDLIRRIMSLMLCAFLILAAAPDVIAQEASTEEDAEVMHIVFNAEKYVTDLDHNLYVYAYCQPDSARFSPLTFTIADTEIAEFSDQYIIPKNYGETTITATAENGVSATVPVIVRKGNYADSIFSDGNSSFYLESGKSVQLKYQLSSSSGNTDFSDETVEFVQISGLKDIVSISDQGIVTAGDRYGYATVAAMISNGNMTYFSINVGPAVKKITFDTSKSYVLSDNTGSIILSEYINTDPAGYAANAVEFSVDNKNVMQIQSGYYGQIIKTGKVTVTATYKGNSSVTAKKTFEIKGAAAPSSIKAVGSRNRTVYKDFFGNFEVSYQPGNSSVYTEWSSSNPDVLSVNGNFNTSARFLAIKPGSAVVTAKSTANPKLSVTFNVTVKDEKPPKGSYDESITIAETQDYSSIFLSTIKNPDVYYFRTGQQYYYSQNVTAGQCMPATPGFSSWLSSTGYFETYDGGAFGTTSTYSESLHLLPLKAGEVTYESSERTIRMVIVDNDEMLLNVAKTEIPAGTETNAYASCVPYDPDVKYSSSDEDIFTVDRYGTVHAVRPGTAVLSAVSGGQRKERELRVLFSDVMDSSKFFFSPVYWAYENNITTGTSTAEFSPNTNVTRGQIVTFLYRAAGQPEVSGANSFTDVKESSYCYNAVLWASQNKITTGTSETTFSPNDNCTRAQIVTFLYRYLNQPEVSGEMPFKDVKSDKFYYNAVLWATQNGITTGTSSTTFSPNDICTRGQAVTFLYRAVE